MLKNMKGGEKPCYSVKGSERGKRRKKSFNREDIPLYFMGIAHRNLSDYILLFAHGRINYGISKL